MSAVHYVFAGGGTGGHLYPGLAVAAALRALQPDAVITFFTTTRPLDRQLLAPGGFPQVEQSVRPVTLKPWRWPAFWRAWRTSVNAARAFLREHRPRGVLGLGGYAAGPPVVAAHALGIRTAILNPDAIPGRANRYLAHRADLVVMQWEHSRRFFSRTTNCQALGCPIRVEFASADRAAGCARFGLDPLRPVLLATGASQGAHTLNEIMRLTWPRFVRAHPDWQLLHLTGSTDEAPLRAAYEVENAPATVMAFTPEMPAALAACDVVVSRAGASTLAEITAVGRPAVLLPYPFHRDRHQHANAQVLVEAGAAVLMEDHVDPAADSAGFRETLERLTEARVRERMAESARSLARPNAAETVATWLLQD